MSETTPVETPRKRGRPPKLRAAPVTELETPADDALAHLEAEARAPMDAAAAAGEALQASLARYAARAAACGARLAAREAEVLARLQRVQALPLREWALQLGGHSTLIAQLTAATERLQVLFQSRADAKGEIASQRQVLARIPARIAALTAADAHACPVPPPRCECPTEWIKTLVERAEVAAAALPRDLDAVAHLLHRIQHARAARADVVVLPLLPAPSQTSPRVTTTPGDAGALDEGA